MSLIQHIQENCDRQQYIHNFKKAKMPQGCCVPMCNNAGCHRFPKDPNRKKMWLKAICRDSLISPDMSRVCRDHFLPEDYKDETSDARSPFLKKNAVPSKFPWTGNRLFEEKKDAWRKVKVLGKKRGNLVKRKKHENVEEKDKGAIRGRTDKVMVIWPKLMKLKVNMEENLVNNEPIKTEALNQSEGTTDQSLLHTTTQITTDEIKKVDPLENNLNLNSNEVTECRACLQSLKAERMYGLFQSWNPNLQGLGNTIADDLTNLSNIQLSENDVHSKFICHSCCLKLSNACHFKLLVQENDRILRAKIQQDCDKVWPKPIQVEKSINGSYENSLPFNVDIKQEVLSDDEACNMEEGYTDANLMDIKVEPEEFVDPPPIVVGVTSLKEFPTGEIAMQLLNGETKTDNEFLLQAVKEEPVSDSEETDLSLECLLCTRPFHSVTGLKAHVIAQHSYQTVGRKMGDRTNDKHVCATCRRTFTTSTDLMVHETVHNKHVCYGCSAKFDSFASLSAHGKRCKALASADLRKPKTLDDVLRTQIEDGLKREINEVTTLVKEESKMYSCPLCNEIFTDSYYVKIHLEIHHSNECTNNTSVEENSAPMEIEMLESIFNEET